MANARLLKGGGDGPNLAGGACNLCCDLFQNLEARRADAIVIGDQNAHETLFVLVGPGSDLSHWQRGVPL